MNKYFPILLVINTFMLLSCSTIHYNFEGTPSGDGDSEWHHIGIFQFVEFSSPVRMKRICKNGVYKITSRKSPFQGLLALVPWLGWAYSPTQVTYECAEKVALDGKGGTKNESNSESTSTNTNTININISPDTFKDKKPKEKKEKKKE